ncbi:hypothetical protein [Actibacterium sp. 188UL27-1]|uniref:hypothetical protein n=1 Tax=Actibacterium sp. 188UL27-1 TaxID=2786961 RepID=UPI0019581BD4|nr:hypothetical protein [Actibacterium sp. 188UL27-1]MBM7069930.1 hypothetical protein [Actibacterium sp. 188UL27-1]
MEKLNKLGLIISALAITGVMSMPANAMSRDELAAVRDLVEARNAAGLREFLQANPQVMNDTPLGKELSDFMQEARSGNVFGALAARSAVSRNIQAAVEAAKSDSSLY